MESTQTTVFKPSPAPRGLFGSGIPSSVAFAVGILLFLLPFAEIKCGGTKFVEKSGLDITMGKSWKKASVGGTFGENELKKKTLDADKEENGNTQIYALAALGLAVLGLLLSLAAGKKGGMGGLVTGLLASGAMIGLMLEMKKLFNNELAKQAVDKTKEGTSDLGFDKIGQSLDNMRMTMSFTPWFFVAIAAFLAAALFSYMRSRPSA